jgi:hypothetical protein
MADSSTAGSIAFTKSPKELAWQNPPCKIRATLDTAAFERALRFREKVQIRYSKKHQETIVMPVKLREEEAGRILVLELSGKLDKKDYAHFMPEVDGAIKKHGKIRLLVEMHDFHGWTLGAVWEDTKFDVHHFSHIERLALVGDKQWEAGMATFCKPFTTATVRYFDETKSKDASSWIHEGCVPANQPTG